MANGKIVLLGAAAALLLMGGAASAATGVGSSCFDAGMTDASKEELRQLLSGDRPPWELDDAADAMGAYPNAQRCLRARAADLRQQWELRDRNRGYSDYVLRYGDNPALLAAHYTGNGQRWKDVPPMNAGMSTTPSGPSKWYGTIRLPLSWAIWSKRPATPASGGGGAEPGGGGGYTLEVVDEGDWDPDELGHVSAHYSDPLGDRTEFNG